MSATDVRFRSDVVAKRAGRFMFDGYVESGWKRPPAPSEMRVDVAVGEPFPRLSHACWWTPTTAVAEAAEEQRMSWEGGPAAPDKGKKT
jgi:hypothetical protein